MPETLPIQHVAWNAVLSICWHLFLFTAVVTLLVFTLRVPLRRHKGYDLEIFNRISHLQTPANSRLMLAITFLGKQQFLIPANLLLIGVFFFTSDYHWYAFDILVLSLSSLLLMLLLKQLFRRKRPQTPLLFAARGMSFPSGHAMMSVCFYGLLMHLGWLSFTSAGMQWTILIAGILLILLIGFSRIYFRVHYLSDVLAGFVIGAAWLYMALRIFNDVQQLV